MPRDREGRFHRQVFERSRSSEPRVADGRDGDVRSWGEHPQGRGSGPNADGRGTKSPVPSVVSIGTWNTNSKPGGSARGLEHWRIIYLDGIHYSIRHGDEADSTIILTALGVDLAGNKAVQCSERCAQTSAT